MIKSIRIITYFAVAFSLLLLTAGTSVAQLSGDYYIPQGDHDTGYESLADAFADLNENGASGAVTFWIDGDLDERESTLLIKRNDLTEENSLLIKPTPGTTPTIRTARGEGGDRTGSTGFAIERAHWVTIDGSNQEDGDSRDLTILLDEDLDSLPGTTSMMTIYSTVDNITVKNTNITHTYGELGRGLLIDRSAGQDSVVQNITIHNTTLGDEDQVLTTAVFLNGVFATGIDPDDADLMDNITITDTDIYGTRWCIYVQSASNLDFTGNNCVINGYSAESDQSQRAGIQLQLAKDADVSNNTITFGDINYQTNNLGVGGIFLNRNHGPLLISNNYINMAGIENTGSGTNYVIAGIASHVAGTVDLDPEYNIYHNTIILDSDAEQAGKHVGIGPITETLSGRFDIRNNIVVNRKDAENSYAIENLLSGGANEEATFESDYNNLYVTGDASVGYWENEAQAGLSEWNTASGLDENSVSVEVGFVSDDSPELDEASAQDENLRGTAIADVTTDFFGNDRDAESPFMGAHEGEAVGVSIPVASDMPQQISLNQNYPNPFNPSTIISYELPNSERVTLQVYNVYGQLIQTLVSDQQMNAGAHQVQFDASNLASGIYIYRLTAGEFTQSARMTLIK